VVLHSLLVASLADYVMSDNLVLDLAIIFICFAVLL
jgi:hypothetical protein